MKPPTGLSPVKLKRRLRVPGQDGANPQAAFLERWRAQRPAVDRAVEALEEFNVGGQAQPTDADGYALDPQMPHDITAVTNTELGTLYGQFVAMATWLDGEATEKEMRAVEAEAYVDHLKAATRLSKTGTVPDKDARTNNDPEVISAEQELLVAQAKAKLLRTRVRGLERCASALSREITRRSPDLMNPDAR